MKLLMKVKPRRRSTKLILKAKPYPNGTIRKHGGRTMVKRDGGWLPASEGKSNVENEQSRKPDTKMKRTIKGDSGMYNCLKQIGLGKGKCLDDLVGKDRSIYNGLTKAGLITWNHLSGEEYIPELTESGKKALNGAKALEYKYRRQAKR